MDDNTTLAEHAEAWARESGEVVPERDTPEWQALYERWVEYAFADLARAPRGGNAKAERLSRQRRSKV